MKRIPAIAILVLFWNLGVVAATKTTAIPNLSGTWVLDPAGSKLGQSQPRVSMVVIEQTLPNVRFDYWSGERNLGVETISTDGEARQRYSTRIEKAVTYGRFEKSTFRVLTDHVINSYWGQQYTEIEEWTISTDGNTLTHKLSDGKIEVFRRQKPAAQP